MYYIKFNVCLCLRSSAMRVKFRKKDIEYDFYTKFLHYKPSLQYIINYTEMHREFN